MADVEHFVTILDSVFVPQGIALQASMGRHFQNYILWVICVDGSAHKILNALSLRNVRPIKLSEFETEDLCRVKVERSIAEYCWTLTPFAPGIIFKIDPHVERVTYLDADLWFMMSPEILIGEMVRSGKSVLITKHNYSPEYDQAETSGRFCVQFMTFSRDGSEAIRRWWENRCIEWCFARYENGKFGDQKYLDDWPKVFDGGFHILEHPGLTLAPWNANRYPYSEAVFFHFHGLRLMSPTRAFIGDYQIPKIVVKKVYYRYIEDLALAIRLIESHGFTFKPQYRKRGAIWRFSRIIRIILISINDRWNFGSNTLSLDEDRNTSRNVLKLKR